MHLAQYLGPWYPSLSMAWAPSNENQEWQNQNRLRGARDQISWLLGWFYPPQVLDHFSTCTKCDGQNLLQPNRNSNNCGIGFVTLLQGYFCPRTLLSKDTLVQECAVLWDFPKKFISQPWIGLCSILVVRATPPGPSSAATCACARGWTQLDHNTSHLQHLCCAQIMA